MSNNPLHAPSTKVEVSPATVASIQGTAYGDWSLSYVPKDGATGSVLVTAQTGLDIAPAFYRADKGSPSPSLQRLQGAPAQGMDANDCN